MGKQKQSQPYILWLLAAYMAGQILVSGHLSLQLDPAPTNPILCEVAAGPQESLGDGPGNA